MAENVSKSMLKQRIKIEEKIEEFNNLMKQHPNVLFLQNIKQAYTNLRHDIRKPAIAFVGPSDSGKSTLINTLLGENILPAEYSPTTSTVIRIVHEQDKPHWLKGNTLVIGGEEDEILMFTLAELSSGKSPMIVAQGDRTLITQYGTRGQSISQSINEYLIIYTFIQSDLLEYCELWDTPGTSAGIDNQSTKEENLSEKMRLQANILVVTSVIVQFLHTNVVGYLDQSFNKYQTKEKEELSELLILATMADFISSPKEHERLIEEGWKKVKALKEKKLNGMDWLTYEWYRNHCFTYSSTQPESVQSLKERLMYYLQNEEERKNQKIENEIPKIWRNCWNEYSKKLEKLVTELEEHNDIQHEIDAMKKNRAAIFEIHNRAKTKLLQQLPVIVENAIYKVSGYYDILMTEDNLIELMDVEDIANNDASKKRFTEKLVKRLESVMEDEGLSMKEVLSEQYGEQLQEMQRLTDVKVPSFNYEAETAAILASGVVGGTFLWVAATTASNLGLYILVAQIGGILTNLGIISSPIWLTTLVAATGGPIAWAVGITALVGIGAAALFGNWKKSFADQLMKGFKEHNVRYEIINNFNKFSVDYAKDVAVYFDKLNLAYDSKIAEMEQGKKRTNEEIMHDIQLFKKIAKQLGMDK